MERKEYIVVGAGHLGEERAEPLPFIMEVHQLYRAPNY